MDRFVAFQWNPGCERQHELAAFLSQSQRATSPDFAKVIDASGLVVLARKNTHGGPAMARLKGVEGVVIGRLFRNGSEDAGRVAGLDASDSARILSSAGGHLIRNFWGNYLAIWRDPGSAKVHLLRDPCGGVPCFMTALRGVQIAFAYAEDIAALPGFRPEPDWQTVLAFNISNFLPGASTAIRNTSELLPGHVVTLCENAGLSTVPAWDPVAIAATPAQVSFNAARDELRDTARGCVAAWAGAYSSIVVRVSGGLDSSILLNLLSRSARARLTALHLPSRITIDRELTMAREAAQHAGVHLLEPPATSSAADLRAGLTTPRLMRPNKQVLGMEADEQIRSACQEVDADALVAGHGGDTLFVQRAGAEHMLADYVRAHGLGRDFWRTAYCTSMLLEFPIWEVIARSLQAACTPLPRNPYAYMRNVSWRQKRLLRAEVIDALPDKLSRQPWHRESARLPPGKAQQLHRIVDLRHYHSVRGAGVACDALIPFASQPIVEFCLRTPIWIFGEGGLDRALERRAFEDILPAAIARRTDKGMIDSELLDDFRANVDFIRELILDGIVIRQGWYERDRVERALRPDYLVRGAAMEDLYNLFAAEIWAHAWGFA